ncbi:5-(carboxyamino)imidazole ribonucleotide synthase [bacterium]|nr:5-(carboxyamino)imidazole ribonucleotide synthase [bacterium]
MRIGILGAGQLARMLALAGSSLGHTFVFYDQIPKPSAAGLGTYIQGSFTDKNLLEKFASLCDVVTYEFENVPISTVKFLKTKLPVHPDVFALEQTQDRFLEKSLFKSLSIPTAHFEAVDSDDDLKRALQKVGYPAVLKARRMGYDGKGQCVIRSQTDAEGALARVGLVPCILEQFVSFTREVSIIAARARNGSLQFYPLNENVHVNGILDVTRVRKNDPLFEDAKELISKLLEHFKYVGVLTLELFDVNGKLVANEYAPRVHNSGHWTIDGSYTSQFENHIRAISTMPLKDVHLKDYAAMVNCVGWLPKRDDIIKIPGAYLHLYGKEIRPGRKVGHVNLYAKEFRKIEEMIAKVKQLKTI